MSFHASRWPRVALGDVIASVKPGFASGERSAEGTIQFRMNNVDRTGNISWSTVTRVPADTKKLEAYGLEAGDVLFNQTNSRDLVGKTALFEGHREPVVFSNHFLRLRPRFSMIEGAYLARYLQSLYLTGFFGAKCNAWVNQATYGKDDLLAQLIPLPPVNEQRRIAAILDKADAIRRKRQQALALADDFLRSAFLEMFGDPVTNPRRLPVSSLGTIATFTSGGTPSKERKDFWEGSFPWVSPKDMKRERIDAAEDAVSDLVFNETSLKRIPPRTVLIVVRGMILAHTVPVGISTVPLAINQDMKAIQFDEAILPEFGLWCLKVQHSNMLSKIDTAAHGTKRFELDRLKGLPILIPQAEDQRQFVRLYEAFHAHRQRTRAVAQEADALFASLSQRAFRGDLLPDAIPA